jgi:hypothetical protein
MNVFVMLGLRSEFEELVLNFRIPGNRKAGTILNLSWFLSNDDVRDGNERKVGYNRARQLALELIEASRDKVRPTL